MFATRDALAACLAHEETYADGMLPKLRARAERAEAERDRLAAALQEMCDDVKVVLDQHVSQEVNKEARRRLILRMVALAGVVSPLVERTRE